jgi:hypothetical protein
MQVNCVLDLYRQSTTQVVKAALHTTVFILFQFTTIAILFSNCFYPCQLSLWEETGASGENPRLSAER